MRSVIQFLVLFLLVLVVVIYIQIAFDPNGLQWVFDGRVHTLTFHTGRDNAK